MAPASSEVRFLRLSKEGLVERIADLVAEAILSGRMPPGTHVSESTIARDMGVSRAPVREAARLLESSGLLDYRANRGFFVHDISADALEQLYELRLVIETAAVERLVARGGADAALPELRERLAALHETARSSEGIFAHISADMAFHRAICVASGNPRFVQVFDQVANETKLGLMLIGRLYEDPTKIAETHQPIVDAIAAGDAPAARAALEHHIGTARDLVPPLFRNRSTRTTP